MITASKELRQYLKLFKTQSDACEKLAIDEATLSKLANEKEEYNVSSSVVAKILSATGFEFEKAFHIDIEDEHPSRRKEDK